MCFVENGKNLKVYFQGTDVNQTLAEDLNLEFEFSVECNF